MRKITWVCDKCGFEKRDSDENDSVESVFSGWMIIRKYDNGECETIDLCPECADEFCNK